MHVTQREVLIIQELSWLVGFFHQMQDSSDRCFMQATQFMHTCTCKWKKIIFDVFVSFGGCASFSRRKPGMTPHTLSIYKQFRWTKLSENLRTRSTKSIATKSHILIFREKICCSRQKAPWAFKALWWYPLFSFAYLVSRQFISTIRKMWPKWIMLTLEFIYYYTAPKTIISNWLYSDVSTLRVTPI